jgi:hypothetical protein
VTRASVGAGWLAAGSVGEPPVVVGTGFVVGRIGRWAAAGGCRVVWGAGLVAGGSGSGRRVAGRVVVVWVALAPLVVACKFGGRPLLGRPVVGLGSVALVAVGVGS